MPLDPHWQDVNRDLPDARARISRAEKQHRLLGWMERVFCVNCGADGGMVSKDWAAHIFFLCNDCVFQHGALPLQEIPEALVKGH